MGTGRKFVTLQYILNYQNVINECGHPISQVSIIITVWKKGLQGIGVSKIDMYQVGEKVHSEGEEDDEEQRSPAIPFVSWHHDVWEAARKRTRSVTE